MDAEFRDLADLAERVVEQSRRAGAEVAEAKAREGWELTTKVRLGEPELVQEAGHRGVALRIIKDGKVALTSTSDLSEAGVQRCVDDAMSLVELTEPDPFAGPADPQLICSEPHPNLDLYDEAVGRVDAEQALRLATAAEEAALKYDKRITLSDGATFTRVTGKSVLVLSGGFRGAQRGSYASLVVSPVALDEGEKRRRGFHWTARRHFEELDSPESVGEESARRALRQLGARKVATQEAPVVFDPDVARSILGTFGGCVMGGSIWRQSSYLVDRLSTQVASDKVTIVDDPLIPRGPGSRPFDGEGLRSVKNTVVERGMLRTYLLDSYSARKLKMASTASAGRGGASVSASSTNFLLLAGDQTPEALLQQTGTGLYVTEMMGFGFNAVTGDFSRGASGFWIEGGELAYPVSEVTISSNLDAMLKGIDGVANNLDLKTAVAAPTFRISSMTIAGT